MPKISIIVPIYNVEKYLTKCLLSIQAQTIKDFECIMVDDCSPDNCATICKKFETADTRFKYIKHTVNKGLGGARNTGLDHATGDFISFIDSDDSIQPNFYESLLPEATKYGWVCSGRHYVNEQGKTIRPCTIASGLFKASDNDLKILSQDRIYDISTVCSCLFRQDVINNIRFDACKYGEDYIFSLELFATHGQIYFKPIYLYDYLVHQDSLSGGKTVDKFQILTFLNSFTALLRRIKHTTHYSKLRPIYINNFENRAYVKELCHNGIDYVFPYVDNTDPSWQKQFLKAKGISPTDKEVNGVNRFRPNDYLKYLFRGIEKNLPWINKIHLVVASESQVPSWIDKNKIHIVLHEDIIPEELLPTFNSSTIEMFYPNIVGLSDRILYGNDDMFVLNPCNETDFFDGLSPRLTMMKVNNTNTTEVWRVTFQNSFKLATGITKLNGYYMAPEHTIAPYVKNIMQEFNQKHYKEIYNSCTKFRDFKNYNIYFYADYMWVHNLIKKSNLKFSYIWNDCPEEKIKKFFNEAAIVCINDTTIEKNNKTNTLITNLFNQKFKEVSIYEKGCTKTKQSHPYLFKFASKEYKKAINVAEETEINKKNIRADGQSGFYLYF